jgi:hypothetical protein
MKTPFIRFLAILLLSVCALHAAEHKGQVKFNGLPLPGATVTVTATQGDRKLSVVADENGNYLFPDLPDGMWTFQVEMLGFAPVKQDIAVEGNADIPVFDLKMLSFDEIKAVAAPPEPRISVTQNPPATTTASPAADAKNAKNKKGATAAAARSSSRQRSGRFPARRGQRESKRRGRTVVGFRRARPRRSVRRPERQRPQPARLRRSAHQRLSE